MATAGAEFKRRVKFQGLTYTEIENGSGVDVSADVSVAGLGRELGGDHALHGLRDLALCAADGLQGIFARDEWWDFTANLPALRRVTQIAA